MTSIPLAFIYFLFLALINLAIFTAVKEGFENNFWEEDEDI